MKRKPKCAWCRNVVQQAWSAINRAKRIGAPIYCGRECSGLGRRKNLTDAQKKEAKRLYDIEYRANNAPMLKRKKRAYHKRTYDPAVARVARAATMPRHIEYCRQPEYQKYKRAYDRVYNAKRNYGPLAEAFLTLRELDREISDRASDYEIRLANGTLNKKTRRTQNAAAER